MGFDFNKIADAPVTTGGNWIRDGEYEFLVKRISCDKKRAGHMFIVEFYVLEAKAVDSKYVPNPVGTSCSLALNLDNNEMAVGNAKDFILHLLCEKEASGPEFAGSIEAICAPNNPMRGMKIGDETYRKPQKKNPAKDFMGHNWRSRPGQTNASLAEGRAILDRLFPADAAPAKAA